MRNSRRFLLCLFLLSPLAAVPCQALLVNGSFEDPAIVGSSAYAQGAGPTGWTVGSGNMILTNTNAGNSGVAQNGSQLFDLPGSTGLVGSTTQGTFSQTFSGLAPGGLYQVSYFLSSYATGSVVNGGGTVVTPGSNGSYSVAASLSGSPTAGASTSYDGSNVPPASTGSASVQGYGSAAAPWIAQSFVFRAGATGTNYTLLFTLLQTSASGGGARPGVDNVTVAAVPEPGAWTALALGALGLAVWRRPRRASR